MDSGVPQKSVSKAQHEASCDVTPSNDSFAQLLSGSLKLAAAPRPTKSELGKNRKLTKTLHIQKDASSKSIQKMAEAENLESDFWLKWKVIVWTFICRKKDSIFCQISILANCFFAKIR